MMSSSAERSRTCSATRVGCAGSPGAVAVAAEVEGVDVIVVAESLRDPVPVAGVVEGAVDEDERGLVVLAVVPELEFEAVGVEEVGDGFHGVRFPLSVESGTLKIYTLRDANPNENRNGVPTIPRRRFPR